ncbi:hypothetical protein N7509_007962 [Penicillium cosmopolitanum]|uniref:F-box domain-containing protein n=1 Tax=Penicillium cosmopolitanum TaxID=1131564 RepID=A0A9W9VZS9_9EURO|nr:uncharacterized protein N7509_007962 [Penicillium cosmopolitanum]KAJ5392472.1 hypothetical protein N7509_007962 [Penicillium cosmopolitanum]
MSFIDIPNELIYLVGKYLPQKSISSLMQTNHMLCGLLQKTLYDKTPESKTYHILYKACEHGRVDLAREMLKRLGAQQRPKDIPRFLAAAAAHGHVDVLQLILEQENTDPNEDCIIHSTALVSAAGGGHLEALKTLLEHPRVQPDQLGRYGRTPFFAAAENGNVSIMKELLKTGRVDLSHRNNEGRSAIHFAGEMGQEEAMRFLLSLHTDPGLRDGNGSTPLATAAAAGASGVVKILLETGRVDANAKDHASKTPLHRVFEFASLIDSHLVRDQEKKEKVHRMLSGEVLPPHSPASELRRKRTEEHTLTTDGYEVIRQLLALEDIELEPCDSEGRTPLSHAAGVCSVEGTRLLIATGKVDLESKDNDGWSPATWLECQYKPKPTPDEIESDIETPGFMLFD